MATYHNYNGTTINDYCICSASFLNNILNFQVGDFFPTMSDHCPITVNFFSQIKKNSVDTSLRPKPVTVKWTKIIEQFVTNLNNICLNEITGKISDLKHNLTESNSSAEIPARLDNLVHDFSD